MKSFAIFGVWGAHAGYRHGNVAVKWNPECLHRYVVDWKI